MILRCSRLRSYKLKSRCGRISDRGLCSFIGSSPSNFVVGDRKRQNKKKNIWLVRFPKLWYNVSICWWWDKKSLCHIGPGLIPDISPSPVSPWSWCISPFGDGGLQRSGAPFQFHGGTEHLTGRGLHVILQLYTCLFCPFVWTRCLSPHRCVF